MLPGTHLHILWTRDDLVTWRELVVPYATNSLKYGWWERVTLVVWGSSTALADLGVEVVYWGERLARVQAGGGAVLTI